MHRGDLMTINISELLKKKIASQELHLVFEEESFSFDGENIVFSKPVRLDGTLSLTGDLLILDCTISTELILNCSRCLEEFKYPVEIEIEEKFSNNPDNKDDDIIFIDSDTIDITEIIQNDIGMSLPFKKLCKDECKGLCQHCGTNLNVNTCKCEQDDIDPRLAKLKDMFTAD